MKAIHKYFTTNKKVTLFWMWVFFAIAFGYMLMQMYLLPQLNFWIAFIPGLICLYLRIAYAKAAYDPTRDRFSDQYKPRAKK